MLNSLSIRNVVLGDKLDLEFSAVLSILTSETGAGKSILLDSLRLVLVAGGVDPERKERNKLSVTASLSHCRTFRASSVMRWPRL